MVKLNDGYWAKNDKYWLVRDKVINQFIYRPTRLYNRTFCYDILNYYYRHIILSPKSSTILETLDDIRLFTKKYNNPWIWYSNPITIPITFEEFLNNRSLSKYTQKASKEINYGNSNSNNNNN